MRYLCLLKRNTENPSQVLAHGKRVDTVFIYALGNRDQTSSVRFLHGCPFPLAQPLGELLQFLGGQRIRDILHLIHCLPPPFPARLLRFLP